MSLLLGILLVSTLSVALTQVYASSDLTTPDCGYGCNLPTGVTWFSQDTITGGNWAHHPAGSPIGMYGSYAYILPDPPVSSLEIPVGNFSVPAGGYSDLVNPPYNWTGLQLQGLMMFGPKLNSPYYDEYSSHSPKVTYYLNGTFVDPIGGNPTDIQYPVFEWGWGDFTATQTVHQSVYYPIGNVTSSNHWRLAAWDDGGERGLPTNGYMNFTLHFPQGVFLLSLYSYDLEGISRTTELYRVYDSSGTQLLASKQVGDPAWNNGIYESFRVVAPSNGLTITVQVYNDAGQGFGGGKTNNVVLSGIFVDQLPCKPNGGYDPCWWLNNLASWSSPYTTSTGLQATFGSKAPSGTFQGALKACCSSCGCGGGCGGYGSLTSAKNELACQAVAALLNAADSNLGYPLTTSWIISQVTAAFNSGNANTMLSLANTLSSYNWL